MSTEETLSRLKLSTESKASIRRPAWVTDHLENPTGRGIRIGVIDSGWDDAFDASRVERGIGFVDPDDDFAVYESEDIHDRIGHGTACGALILRIAPQATLYPIRVFGDQLETSPATIQSALQWAIEQKFDVVNVSLGTFREDALVPLYKVCEQAKRKEILIVSSSHNRKERSYPSVFENVISVGVGAFDDPFRFQYRPNQAVECIAKGVHDHVPWRKGIRRTVAGTSFAAPIITGIVALLVERYATTKLEDVRRLLDEFSQGHDAQEHDE